MYARAWSRLPGSVPQILYSLHMLTTLGRGLLGQGKGIVRQLGMSDIKRYNVAVMITLADTLPPKLHIMCTYGGPPDDGQKGLIFKPTHKNILF